MMRNSKNDLLGGKTMKEIRKEVQRTEEIITYESVDGKIFKTKEDCERWEKSYEFTIRAAIGKIPQIETNCGNSFIVSPSESEVLVLKPRNMEDINVINAYGMILEGSVSNPLTQDDIGNIVMIETGFGEDCFYMYRMEEYLQCIIDTYAKIRTNMEKLS